MVRRTYKKRKNNNLRNIKSGKKHGVSGANNFTSKNRGVSGMRSSIGKTHGMSNFNNKTRRVYKNGRYINGGLFGFNSLEDFSVAARKAVSSDYYSNTYNKLSNDLSATNQFNMFKASNGITIFDDCQGLFNKYFMLDPNNAKDVGMKNILMTYLVYKNVLKMYIIKDTDYGYNKFISMIDVYFTQDIFDKKMVKGGNTTVYMIFPKKSRDYSIKNEELINPTDGKPYDFIKSSNFFNKDSRINGHNLAQGIPDFGSVNDNTTIGYNYKVYLNYKSNFGEQFGDNEPFFNFVCRIPDAGDSEYDRKLMPNVVNLFYNKVNYILSGFSLNKGFFTVKPDMPQGDAKVHNTAIIKNYYMEIPTLCELLRYNINKNSNVCLLPNADKQNKDRIVSPLNTECIQAINHVISAKMLYNKLGTNHNNTYPDYLNVNTLSVYNSALHDNNEERNPYKNYKYKEGKGFVSLGKKTHDQYRRIKDMSITFRDRFDYTKKSHLRLLIRFLSQVEDKTNNTPEHYAEYESFIAKLNEDPEYEVITIYNGNQEPAEKNTQQLTTATPTIMQQFQPTPTPSQIPPTTQQSYNQFQPPPPHISSTTTQQSQYSPTQQPQENRNGVFSSMNRMINRPPPPSLPLNPNQPQTMRYQG